MLAFNRTDLERLFPSTTWERVCTTCGACANVCPLGISPMRMITDMRRFLIGEGELRGSPAVALQKTGRVGNPWGMSPSDRLQWAAGLNVPLAGEHAAFEVLYWVGCAAAYDRRVQKVARSVVRLLQAANVNFAVLGPEELDLPYSFEALAEAGSMLGSGSIIIADDTISIPEMALRTARFYRHESCGKCTPCREGTNWTVKMLERVVRGEATPMDLDIIASVQENIIGHCLCVLGDSMAMPVGSMVRRWRGEFESTIARAREAGPAPLDVEPAVATAGVGA